MRKKFRNKNNKNKGLLFQRLHLEGGEAGDLMRFQREISFQTVSKIVRNLVNVNEDEKQKVSEIVEILSK